MSWTFSPTGRLLSSAMFEGKTPGFHRIGFCVSPAMATMSSHDRIAKKTATRVFLPASSLCYGYSDLGALV